MRVLVLGGGYAGVVAVSRLERRLPEAVELLLVDRRDTHLIRHELHRVIRRPEFADTIQVPFGRIFDRAEFVQGAVSAIEPESGSVRLEDGRQLDYDAALVCFGASPAYYGLEGVEEHGIPLHTTADAERIGSEMRMLLEDGTGQVVIGGGGLAGIQAAGEVAEIRRQSGGSDLDITLVEQAPRLVPRFDSGFDRHLQDALSDLQVQFRTGAEIVDATADSVVLANGTSLQADLFVWTGGIGGRAAFEYERPQVRADLRIGERTFAAGDAVQIVDDNGSAVTPSAQTAIGAAGVAAANVGKAIEARRAGEPIRPRYDRYRDESFVWVVSVGDRAVAKVGPQMVTGRAAKALKSTVGVGYLSTAGSIRDAVTLAREEFGFSSPSGAQSAGGSDPVDRED